MSHARYLIGDVFDRLRELPDNSVDLVMSSPPFLALRSYLPADHEHKAKEIGSEPTPGAFIDTLLDVVEECRRVLAPHGSLVFELGDTYANEGGQAKVESKMNKSLCMIPQSFAWALSYGRNPFTGREIEPWRVRNVVAWCRPNPPVGALGDKFRPATSYLTVACTARDRYFDLDAVRTEHTCDRDRGPSPRSNADLGDVRNDTTEPTTMQRHPAGAPPLDYWVIPTQPYRGSHYATFPTALVVPIIKSMCPPGGTVLDPFAGSGTTLQVALGHGRDAIGIDLDERNADLAYERIGGLFLDIVNEKGAA